MPANRNLFAQALESVRHELERGHLGPALLVYLMHGVPIAERLARAIIDKAEESRDWNGVLGRLHPKNEKKQRRQHRDLIDPVWKTALELIVAGKPVDDGLFEAIGERLNVSTSTAKRIYYSIPPIVRETCTRFRLTSCRLPQTGGFGRSGLAPSPCRPLKFSDVLN